jgi:dynein-related subfamily AAA family protein
VPSIVVYDANNPRDIAAALEATQNALVSYNAAKAPAAAPTSVSILPNPLLIGVDIAVYRQIEAAINSEKRHIILYGPPGTGKTELARYIADQVSGAGYTLVTGSADWSSQDLIGGYQPMGGGAIAFVPGILLKHFDRPFVIDELNRCDIDKVLGPMFTVLSRHMTTLPYRVDIADADSEQYQIFGSFQPGAVPPIYSPEPDWRIIATINTIDKSSLYQMSYALSRRFAWIFVDVPEDTDQFVVAFLAQRKGKSITVGTDGLVLGRIWRAVNVVRPIGAAPFIDMINHCLAMDEAFDFAAEPSGDGQDMYVDAFKVHVMPILDGVLKDEMRSVADAVSGAIGIASSDPRADTLRRHMMSIGL